MDDCRGKNTMAMTDTHKDILRNNRGALVDSIADIAAVVNELYEMNTITYGMKEDILEGRHHTPTEKKRALLDLLIRRGDSAFGHFYTALVKCGEKVAADILLPSATQPTDDPPESWPPRDYSACEVDVKLVAENNFQMQELFEKSKSNSTIYRMQKTPRGRVLIINNETFSAARDKTVDLEDRIGSHVDATSLCLLFEQLSFESVVKEDLSREKMIEVLDKERRINHETFDCFVCVILSHGTGRGVFGVDGEVANIQEVTDMFNGQNCKTLAGKPKLFFIQACQAKNPVSEITQGLESATIQEKPQAEKPNHVATTRSAAEGSPRADIFTAEATTPDYNSFRNTQGGSWFIQAIVYVFMKHAHEKDLLSMMTKVNKFVCTREAKNKNCKQVSNFNSSLSKDLYFFPGLAEETS